MVTTGGYRLNLTLPDRLFTLALLCIGALALSHFLAHDPAFALPLLGVAALLCGGQVALAAATRRRSDRFLALLLGFAAALYAVPTVLPDLAVPARPAPLAWRDYRARWWRTWTMGVCGWRCPRPTVGSRTRRRL